MKKDAKLVLGIFKFTFLRQEKPDFYPVLTLNILVSIFLFSLVLTLPSACMSQKKETTQNISLPAENNPGNIEINKNLTAHNGAYEFFSWTTYKVAGECFIQNKDRKSGEYAALLKGNSAKSKVAISYIQPLILTSQDKVELSVYIKSQGTDKNGIMFGFIFYDKNLEKIKETTKTCGGTFDWTQFSTETEAPVNTAYAAPVLTLFQSAGQSLFDDVEFKINNMKTEIKGGFEDAVAPMSYCGWRFPIHVVNKNIHGLVDITDMQMDEHIVHYKGATELNGLTMSLEYNVIIPCKYYLSSPGDFQCWYNFNLADTEQSNVYSQEKIDLNIAGRHRTIVPFSSANKDYFSTLKKGPNCIRGRRYFSIMDSRGILVSSTETVDSITSPEKSLFGEARGNPEFYRNCLYTSANLQKYRLEIGDFSSNWKSGGWFAFKIYVLDADNNKYEINRALVEIYSISKKVKNKLKAEQVFDKYEIPSGYYAGSFGTEVPEKIEIKVKTIAASPRGREEKTTEKIFLKEENISKAKPYNTENRMPEAKVEGRLIFMHPSSDLSQNPQEGTNQIKDILCKAKECNFNIICPFLTEGRCVTNAKLNNIYYQRVFKEWDPILELRKATREMGLELYGAICVMTEGNKHPKGILLEHPEWAATDQKGNKKGWMDPAVPEVKDYRINDIIELVKKYDLDGICLDYCRLSNGPSDRGAEIYKSETGIDPRKLTVESKEYIDWYIWTGNHLTDLVRRLREEIKKIKPDCKLGAYVQGVRCNGANKYREYHQNFTEWLKRGYLDFICPTGYAYDMLRFKSWSAKQIKACKEANPNVPVLITIGVKSSHGALQNSQELIDQIDTLRKLNGDGAAFFTWTSLKKWIEDVHQNNYTHSASAP